MWLNSGAGKWWAVQLTKCSVTVAVSQHSWRSGNHRLLVVDPACCLARLETCLRTSLGAKPRHENRSSIERQERVLPSGGQHDSPSLIAWGPRFPTVTRGYSRHVTTLGAPAVRKGSRHFCAAGTFCARFRHAMMQATTRAQSAKQSFIRKTKQRRTQFVADVFDRRRN